MKQQSIVLYVGLSHKGGKPFFATTGNGCNLAGVMMTKIDLGNLKPSKMVDAAWRLEYLAQRLRKRIAEKRLAALERSEAKALKDNPLIKQPGLKEHKATLRVVIGKGGMVDTYAGMTQEQKDYAHNAQVRQMMEDGV